MEKTLYENVPDVRGLQPKMIKVATKSDVCSAVVTVDSKNGICVENSLEERLPFNLLLEAANKYFDKNKRYMCVHLISSMVERNQVGIKCHGFFSELDFQDNPECLNLRFRLILALNISGKTDGLVYNGCIINQDIDVSPHQTRQLQEPYNELEVCIGHEPIIETKITRVNNHLWSVLSDLKDDKVLVGTFKVVFFLGEQSNRFGFCEQIKDKNFLSDMKIVTANGTELSCHKIVLAAHSNVLATMIQIGLEETKRNKIEMPDLSEEAASAFLGYLYERNVKRPWESSSIALELFQAGHKYAIAEMEAVMKRILYFKSNDWFDVEVALYLFLFARNLEDCEELKMKALRVMRPNSQEMLKSELYQDFFKEHPLAALELSTSLLSL